MAASDDITISDGGPDARVVRAALRSELEGQGFAVAGDTVELRGELYVWGEGDRAAALFEFKMTAQEAIESMYQGSWPPTMPPRFAVLPESQRDDPEVDLLGQAGLSVLFYGEVGGRVDFGDMETAVGKIRGAVPRPDRE